MANIGEGRPIMFCPECEQSDDHPKHGLFGEDPKIGRHMDCCRAMGCPTGVCNVILEDDNPGPGRKMIEHIRKVHERKDVAKETLKLQEADPALRNFRINSATGRVELRGAS